MKTITSKSAFYLVTYQDVTTRCDSNKEMIKFCNSIVSSEEHLKVNRFDFFDCKKNIERNVCTRTRTFSWSQDRQMWCLISSKDFYEIA